MLILCFDSPDSGIVETVIENNVTSLIAIDGFQEPGSYRRDIEYKVDIDAAIAIINRAKTCCQFVRYKCVNSKLMASPRASISYVLCYVYEM